MTYTLTVTVLGQDGQPRSGVSVIAELNKTDFTSDGVYLPSFQKVSSDENGIAQLELVSNLVGTQNSRYSINIKHGRGKEENFTIQMPEANTTLAQLVEELPVNTDTQTAAALSADLAEKWATGTEPGGAGTQSSREWAGDAEAQAGNAATSATEAGNAESGALAAESGAVDAENAAAGSAALSEAWATGTEPGGVGTKSSREEAERAEAAADVLPDPVGQDAGLGVQTDGADGFAITPYSTDQILRATRAQIGFHPDIWLAWDDCRPPIAADTPIDDPSVTLSSGHSWELVTGGQYLGSSNGRLLRYDINESCISDNGAEAGALYVVNNLTPTYVDMQAYRTAGTAARELNLIVKYIDPNNMIYIWITSSDVRIIKISEGVSQELASLNILNGVRRRYANSPTEYRVQMLQPAVQNTSIRVHESGNSDLVYEITNAEEEKFAVPGNVGVFSTHSSAKIFGITVREGGAV